MFRESDSGQALSLAQRLLRAPFDPMVEPPPPLRSYLDAIARGMKAEAEGEKPQGGDRETYEKYGRTHDRQT
jgi:hypothetical protein